MLRKTSSYFIAIGASALLLASGYALGVSAPTQNQAKGQIGPEDAVLNASSTPDMKLFWEAWQKVEQEYLNDAKVSDEDKVRGAAAGLVASLRDPYSEYFPPGEAQSFQEDVSGNFGGIGAELGTREGVLTIIAPLKDSPAEAAGLRSGDQILLINSTSTEQMAVEQAVTYIRGPKGTEVKLTIMREGWDKPRSFTIKRQDIAEPTLELEMKQDGIAYIQLYRFNANAERLFLGAIRKAALQNPRGIVLDLRGNPGGYLDVAVDLAGWFLPRGSVVVSQQGRQGVDDVLRANGNAALAKLPVVVLIDEGSASASEILAGALRDQRKMPLVGQTSFGKGTVQELERLSDGSLLKLTIAHWVLPSGQILEGTGLKPDHEVKLSDEDVEKKRDPQLDKALEVMREMINQR